MPLLTLYTPKPEQALQLAPKIRPGVLAEWIGDEPHRTTPVFGLVEVEPA